MAPLSSPLHSGLVICDMDTSNGLGSTRVLLTILLQLLASVTVVRYRPLGRSKLPLFCDPSSHKKVNGSVPPTTSNITEPFSSLLHRGSVKICVITISSAPSTIVLSSLVQPLASVAVTVYNPLSTSISDSPSTPVDHSYVYGDMPPLAFTVTDPSVASKHVVGD